MALLEAVKAAIEFERALIRVGMVLRHVPSPAEADDARLRLCGICYTEAARGSERVTVDLNDLAAVLIHGPPPWWKFWGRRKSLSD